MPAGGSGGGGARARNGLGRARPASAGVLPACAGPGGTGLTESGDKLRLERARGCRAGPEWRGERREPRGPGPGGGKGAPRGGE